VFSMGPGERKKETPLLKVTAGKQTGPEHQKRKKNRAQGGGGDKQGFEYQSPEKTRRERGFKKDSSPPLTAHVGGEKKKGKERKGRRKSKIQ